MERWGERTHSRTQAQLSLNCSALAAARVQLPTLASGVGKTNFTLDISAAAASEEAAASRPCHCFCPARYSPVLATAVPGAGMCVCAWFSQALYLPVCVQGVIVAPRMHQRSQRDVHGVRLRDHVLRKFPCVGGSLSLGAVWVLVPGLERRGVCVPFLDAGGRAQPIPHVPWDAVVHRSWAAHHARNFRQVARVDAL